MRTKIANLLLIFFALICIIMLSFLAYFKFFPPVTYSQKEKEIPAVSEKSVSPIVSIQTNTLIPWLKDSTAAGTGYIVDHSGIVLTAHQPVEYAENALMTVGSDEFYKARKIIDDPRNNIALFQIKNPKIGLPVILFRKSQNEFFQKDENLWISYLKNHKFIFRYSDTKGILPEYFNGFSRLRIENTLARHLIPERMLNMSFGLIPGMTEDGKIIAVRVHRRSPAFRAGIRRGMIITSFQGWDPAGDLIGLSRRMIRLKSGIPVEIGVGSEGKVSVTPVPFAKCPPSLVLYWKLGIFARDLDRVHANRSGLPIDSGVIVMGGHFGRANMLQRGYIITKWNGKKIGSLGDLKQQLQEAPVGSSAYALVHYVVDRQTEGRFLMKRVLPVRIR